MGKTSTKVEKVCKYCIKPFFAAVAEVNRGRAIFCSSKCANSFNTTKGRISTRNQNKENNPNWKGGVAQDNMRYKNRYVTQNPEKVYAHNQVNKAIKSGKLIKPSSCEECSTQKSKIEGHHIDYTKPLEVRWLCRSCHVKIHKLDLT